MQLSRQYIEQVFENWSRWVHQGGLVAGYRSMMSVMIANQGVISFGGGGRASPIVDCVEADIEAALMNLAQQSPKSAEVLRVHYGVKRVGGLSADALRSDKALALGISVKTYESHLTKAKKHVIKALTDERI